MAGKCDASKSEEGFLDLERLSSLDSASVSNTLDSEDEQVVVEAGSCSWIFLENNANSSEVAM